MTGSFDKNLFATPARIVVCRVRGWGMEDNMPLLQWKDSVTEIVVELYDGKRTACGQCLKSVRHGIKSVAVKMIEDGHIVARAIKKLRNRKKGEVVARFCSVTCQQQKFAEIAMIDTGQWQEKSLECPGCSFLMRPEEKECPKCHLFSSAEDRYR
jgi:hypothetical protein